MTALNSHFPNLTSLGDAGPFVERMREVIDHIKMFEDFEQHEIEIALALDHRHRFGDGRCLEQFALIERDRDDRAQAIPHQGVIVGDQNPFHDISASPCTW